MLPRATFTRPSLADSPLWAVLYEGIEHLFYPEAASAATKPAQRSRGEIVVSVRQWLLNRFFAREVDLRVQQALKVIDDKYWRNLSDGQSTTRPWYQVREQLDKVAQVCRVNPLAARLVSMTTDFVIGAGAEVEGNPWVLEFWNHPLNALNRRAYRWCDELSRSGELFLVLSRNPISRMSYVREVPAILIDEIQTNPDDLEREIAYHQLTDDTEGRVWEGRESDADQIMLHYAINRPVGQIRGTSDLAQIVTWLDRYDTWLEDRVRINRYKGAYLWQVQIKGALPGQLEAKRAQYSRVPAPGSIIVTDGHETWSAVQPRIDAEDVEADGKALRLMIAAGGGVPLHFLAEGESATRATAREMGTPTYRHFAHRQHIFRQIVEDVIGVAATRAGHPQVEVKVTFESVLSEVQAVAEG